MRFEHPLFLHFLWTVPLLVLLLSAYRHWRQRALYRLGDEQSVNQLLDGYAPKRFWVKNGLFAAALALLGFAWANPQGGATMRQTDQKSADVFIALDISESMWSNDVRPSRLETTKLFVQKLLRALEGERIGVIFFAGDAFLQMPLSTDVSSLTMLVRSAEPSLISAQGSASATAIALALRSFDPEPTGAGRAVVLFSDGEDHDQEGVDQAKKAYDSGVVVFAVGAGTASGGPIPLPDGSLKRDKNGDLVQTRLNEQYLYQLAHAGGGAAYNINQGDAAIDAIRKEIDRLEKRKLEVRSYTDFESRYQWFLLPAVLLLLLDVLLPWRKTPFLWKKQSV